MPRPRSRVLVDTLDLTHKTIYYSAFIPADSAITNISVYAGRGDQFVFLGGITADAYWNNGAWHDYQFDLSNVQGLMKDCDTLRIVGQRLTAGVTSGAYFLVDELRWIGIDRLVDAGIEGTGETVRGARCE